jgi:hypothetical protein
MIYLVNLHVLYIEKSSNHECATPGTCIYMYMYMYITVYNSR